MVSISSEPIMMFNIPLPKGRGKNKNKVASLNQVPKWHWSDVARVKQEFKEIIADWYISSNHGEPLKSMTIVFELFRHDNRIFDSDNLGFIIKWTIDTIKESGWLIDDDQITYLVRPSVLDRSLIESSVRVSCYKE